MSATQNDLSTSEPRRRLYSVLRDDDLPLAQKKEEALAIGRDVLGVDNAHVQRIRDDGDHEITVSVGDALDALQEGEVLDRATTYCRRTIERDSPLALANASDQGWADDPAYRAHGLECYLGTTLFVDGDRYGTVCFAAADARPHDFDADERLFVELIARLLGREMHVAEMSEEVSAQQSLREDSKTKYRALMDAVPAALFVANTETGETVEVNERATELVGYSRAELIGMDQSRLHPPDQQAQYQEELDRIIDADGKIARFSDGTPLQFQDADGDTVPVEVSSSVVELNGNQFVLGLVQNVSDRRERQEELRVKNRAMNEASVGITIADAKSDDLPLLYANQAFVDLTGYPVSDAVGRNCRFLQGPETDDETLAEVRSAIRDAEPITRELLNYRADGTTFWNQLTVAPVENLAGELTHFVGIQQDVTERKRRNRLIRLLNRVLRHNLRNDMNAVMGYAELLADRHDGETADYCRRIADTANDLVALSEKAQTIERAARHFGEVDEQARRIGPQLDQVASSLRSEYPEATVTVEASDEHAIAAVERFEEVLYELGENAIVHGGSAPTVRFSVDESWGSEGCLGIAIEDDGPGLPRTEQRVLEAGQETPLEHSDSIGLWMVNWITTGLGGTVSADVGSEGTTVTLQLPAVDDPAEGAVPRREQQAPLSLVPD